MKAVIAGTGVDRLLCGLTRASVDTKYSMGEVEYFIKDGIVILPRHKADHSVSPSLINYKANIWALKELGVTDVIGLYAVGSITSRLTPGSFGLVADYIDFSGRGLTFFDGLDNPLRHAGMVNIFDPALQQRFSSAAFKRGEKRIGIGNVYVTTAGPRLETAAEIRAFRSLGADIVGMTLASEASLLAEIGMRFCPVAFSINWAAGLDEEGVSFLEDESVERLSRKLLEISIDALSSL